MATALTALNQAPIATKVFAEINMQELISSQNDLTQSLVQTNFNYLSLAVGIIIGLSVVFYFFNLKPLQDDIKKQRKAIKKSKDQLLEIETRLSSTFDALETAKRDITADIKRTEADLHNKTEAGLKNAESKIAALTGRIDQGLNQLTAGIKAQRVVNEWQMHYVWEAKNVPINVLTTLLDCADESYQYINDFKKKGPFFEEMAIGKFIAFFRKNKTELKGEEGYLKEKIKKAINIPEKTRNELEQLIDSTN